MDSAWSNPLWGSHVHMRITTDSPILLKSRKQLCQARLVTPVYHTDPNHSSTTSTATSPVNLHPDGCLDEDTGGKFITVNLELDVSNSPISRCNLASRQIEVSNWSFKSAPHSFLRVMADSPSVIGTALRIHRQVWEARRCWCMR